MPAIRDIAAALDAALSGGVQVCGDDGVEIHGLGPIETASTGQITHLSGSAYRRFLPTTQASAVLLRESDAVRCPCTALVVANPYLAFAVVSQLFDTAPRLPAGIHANAHVSPRAVVDPTAAIGAGATVAANACIGAGVEVGVGAYIGEDCSIGENSRIYPNATLYHRVRLGARCVIHSGAVIGADGFGFTPNERGAWQAIAQLGGVTLGDDVSVGASTTIDRGTIADTVVGTGVKIDNQVQIGHNCLIGDHTLICGRVGIVGSTKIGRHCVFAGGAGVAGEHPVEICDNVQVGTVTTITRSIDTPGVYQGSVLHNVAKRWRRNALRFQQLDEMAKRLKRLEAIVKRRKARGKRGKPGKGGG